MAVTDRPRMEVARHNVLSLVNIERTVRTVPRSPRRMPIFACWKLKACPGRARLCGYGTQCLLCGEDSMRRSRANLAKRTIRFLRQREIGGKLPLLLIWSAMLKNFLDCKRAGRRAEAGSETTRACDG
jgi:hypothetical protein